MGLKRRGYSIIITKVLGLVVSLNKWNLKRNKSWYKTSEPFGFKSVFKIQYHVVITTNYKSNY